MADESNTSIGDAIQTIGAEVENAVAGNQIQPDQSNNQSGEPSAQEAKQVVNNPNASKTQKQAAKKVLRKLNLKVDGEEYEEELPFDLPDDPKAIEYMRRELQMGKMGQKRAQEKALIEKDVLQFLEDLKKNPRKALSDPAIGMDLKKFAAQIIEEEIENSKKSPEQLALEKAQNELKELKDAQKREKEASDQAERERIGKAEYERMENQILNALEKKSMPNNPAAVKRMADYMLVALNAGKDISPEDIVPLIREDFKADYTELLNSMPDDDALEEFIGKQFVDRIRRKNIAKAKKTGGNPALKAAAKTQSTGKTGETGKVEEKQSFKKFFGI